MDVENILNIDYRTDEGKAEIQKALFEIPPVKRNCDESKDVPIEAIEKVISVISRKYVIELKEITLSLIPHNNDMLYRVAIFRNPYYTYKILYACCIYELLSKSAIYMYNEIKKSEVWERGADA